MILIQLVTKNALRNKRRSALTVLSIAFSMLLLTFMMTIWRSFYIDSLGTSSALRLVTRPRGSSYFMLALPTFYEQKIRSIAGVVNVTPCNLFAGLYRNDRSENAFAQIGTDPETFLKVHPDYEIAPDEVMDWQKDPAGAIADSELVKKYGWKLGDRIILKGSTVPVNMELGIRGTFKAPIPTQAVIFNWQYVENAAPSVRGRNNLYIILTESPQAVNRVALEVDSMFRNSTEPTRTETEKAFELEFLAMLGNVKAFIISICMAALFTTALVCANTMAMSIRERTCEFAVLRTLGFSSRTILRLCVGESVTLSLAGGLLATLASSLLVYAMAHSAEWELYGAVLKIAPLTWVVVLLVAALVGFIGAVFSSYRASRVPIAQALHHNG